MASPSSPAKKSKLSSTSSGSAGSRLSDITTDLFRTTFTSLDEPGAAARLRTDVDRAVGMGMRPGVFAKVGDSNLASYNSLYGLGCRTPVWAGFERFQPTVDRYRQIELPPGGGRPDHVLPADQRKPWNSFSRSSAATYSGLIGPHLLWPTSEFTDGPLGWHPDPDSLPGESMTASEIRLTRPLFVFLNVGTNGNGYGLGTDETADQVIPVLDEIRRLGPVPLLFTIPPQLDEDGSGTKWAFARDVNVRIREIARDRDVLLFDQWLALSDERLDNHGMVSFDGGLYDGLHLETPGGFRSEGALERSVDFSEPNLRYGANLRNLLLLNVLRRLDESL